MERMNNAFFDEARNENKSLWKIRSETILKSSELKEDISNDIMWKLLSQDGFTIKPWDTLWHMSRLTTKDNKFTWNNEAGKIWPGDKITIENNTVFRENHRYWKQEVWTVIIKNIDFISSKGSNREEEVNSSSDWEKIIDQDISDKIIDQPEAPEVNTEKPEKWAEEDNKINSHLTQELIDSTNLLLKEWLTINKEGQLEAKNGSYIIERILTDVNTGIPTSILIKWNNWELYVHIIETWLTSKQKED